MQFILNTVHLWCLYSLYALSFWIIFYVYRFYNLSHGVVVLIGGYAAFTLGRLFFPVNVYFILPLLILVGLFASGSVGFIFEQAVFRRLYRSERSQLSLLLASFGVLISVQSGLVLLFGPSGVSLTAAYPSSSVEIGSGRVSITQLLTMIASVGVFTLVRFVLRSTRAGVMYKAVADDEVSSALVGIDSQVVRSFAFVAGSALGGFTGVLVGMDTGLQPYLGFSILLKGVIAKIVGGAGGPAGIILGAAGLAAIEGAAVLVLPAKWSTTIVFLFFLAVLLFRSTRGVSPSMDGGNR